jgi:hypothetical protein
LFFTATWLLPLGCVFVKLLFAGAKGKQVEERKEKNV